MLYIHPDSVFTLSDKLAEFGKSNNYQRAIGEAINIKGISVYVLGDYMEALNYFLESKDVFEQMGDMKWYSSLLGNIGNALSEMGYSSQAITHYKQALEIQEELNEDEAIIYTLGGIAGLYYDLEQYEKSRDYYRRILSVMDEKDKAEGFYDRTLAHLAQTNTELGVLDSALMYALQAYESSNLMGHTSSNEFNLFVIGEVYLAMQDYTMAMEYFKKSIVLSKELEHERGKVENLNLMGSVYLETKEYRNAIKVCTESLEISRINNYLTHQEKACKCLYTAYKALGSKDMALQTLEELGVIRDSLDHQKSSSQLQQMEFQKKMIADSLANVEKDRQIQEKHEEEVRQKNRTRNMLLISSAFILMLAGGIYSRLRYIRKSKSIIEKEKQLSEDLLLNILPAEVAEELKAYGKIKAQDFDKITILFTDFVSFTKISSQLTAAELVEEIHACFEHFDGLIEKYGIEKVKTIGDAYMAAGGLPIYKPDSVKNTILVALDMQEFIIKRKQERTQHELHAFDMRAGIHTGPIVAGVVGVKKFQYDIWGDTVNTSSRMESACEPGKVNISKDTYVLVKDDPDLSFEYRGLIEVKGKGEMAMYYVSRKLTS